MGAAVAEVERQVARSFLTTARCASFKQAARSLNLPPMVLRRQLQRRVLPHFHGRFEKG